MRGPRTGSAAVSKDALTQPNFNFFTCSQGRDTEGKHMQQHTGWMCVFAFFALLAAADAQAPASPTVSMQFDGKYAFVSSTKVNETFMTTRTTHLSQCPDRKAASLVIANGQARLPVFEGTVGPQGELVMRRHAEPVKRGITPGIEAAISGRIDSNGTIRARQTGYGCSYDLIWQKQPK